MFARRKHGPQEDEPLVPHGLVWQATDEEEQLVNQKDHAGPGTPPAPIEMPRPQDVSALNQAIANAPTDRANNLASTQHTPSPKLGAISPPIAWPSPKSASVIRRSPSAPDFSAVGPSTETQPTTVESTWLANTNAQNRQQAASREVSPSLGSAEPAALPVLARIPDVARLGQSALSEQPVPPQPQAVVQNRKLEVIEADNEQGVGDKSRRRWAFAGMVSSIRSQAGAIYRETRSAMGTASADAGARWKSIHFQERIGRIKPLAQRCALGVGGASQAVRTLLRAWRAENASRFARMGSTTAELSSSGMKSSIARFEDVAKRRRNQRIRIRVVVSPWLNSIIQRSRVAWAGGQESLRRNPRLWTSMAMAALSAVLTIVVISAVNHYTPRADASNKASTPQSNRTPALAPPSNVVASETSQAANRRHVNSAPMSPSPQSSLKAKPSPVATSGKSKPMTRRIHRNDDEDYVAPNTYHYYGNGSGSR